MYKMSNHRPWWGLLVLLLTSLTTTAQMAIDTSCNPAANLPVATADVYFNYGATTNAFTFTNRTSLTIGQPLVGRNVNQSFNVQTGFWSRFLLPPQAPIVEASQGVFPDRIKVSWDFDPLSSDPLDGYIILRDGSYLDRVDFGSEEYLDFNVQAGEFYEYSVIGSNQFGRGFPGRSVGFVNPNGVVTGKIETFSGNPVGGATVRLTPTVGKSLDFDGVDDYVCMSWDSMLPTEMFTFSTWMKADTGNQFTTIADFGLDANLNFGLGVTQFNGLTFPVAYIGNGTTTDTIATNPFASDATGWHQVAVVYNGATVGLYFDGEFQGSTPATMVFDSLRFTLGAGRNGTDYFNGKLDETRLYNRP